MGKGLKMDWEWKILAFADMSRSCAIFSKLLVRRFAENNNEYNNIYLSAASCSYFAIMASKTL